MSTIDDGFKKLLEGVRQADEGRDEIMRVLTEAWEGRKDLGQQLTDLRETITSLEGLVLEQSRKIDELYRRLDTGGQ